MPAFIVFIRESTSNKAEMEIYGNLARPTLAGRLAQPRAFYGKLDVLEGPIFEGAVILNFHPQRRRILGIRAPNIKPPRSTAKLASRFKSFHCGRRLA